MDIRALAHERAEAYLGHTATLDELVTGITELAHTSPGRARQLVESIAAAAEDATGGRLTEEIDGAEQLALKTLGLHAHAVVHGPQRKQEDEKNQ